MTKAAPYSDADVEQLAATVRALIGWPISAGEAGTIVTVVLHALSADDRLLPAGTETREQWGTRLTWDGTTVEHLASDSLENAQRRVDLHAKALREMPGWRATAELVRREVHTTPWTTAAAKDRP